MSVLVVAEHIRGQVRDVTRELITAGRELGPVTVAVIARDPAALAAAVDVEGVEEIVISPEVVDGGARPLRIYSERAEEKGSTAS